VRHARPLVSFAGDNSLHQMTGVELLRDEIGGEGVEQGRVDRRVGAANVVHRVDDAAVEEVAPQAVDEAAGEERVRRPGEPGGVGLSTIGVSGDLRNLASKEL